MRVWNNETERLADAGRNNNKFEEKTRTTCGDSRIGRTSQLMRQDEELIPKGIARDPERQGN